MVNIVKIYEGRIKKGIALLDRKMGRKKWSKKIDLARLDLSDPFVCMIGEVMGEYDDKNLGKLGIEDGGTDYGFEVGDEIGASYDLLTRLWIGALYKLGIKG